MTEHQTIKLYRKKEVEAKRKIFYLHAIQAGRESIGTAMLILIISITWRSVVRFTFRLFYSWQRNLVPTEHENGWSQSRFVHFGAEKSLTPAGVRTPDLSVRSPVIVPPTVLPHVLIEKYRSEVPNHMHIEKRRMYLK